MDPNSIYRLYLRSNKGPLAKQGTVTRGKGGVEDIRARTRGELVTGFEVYHTNQHMFVVNIAYVLAFEHDSPTASPQ